jgi:hypothetical protein
VFIKINILILKTNGKKIKNLLNYSDFADLNDKLPLDFADLNDGERFDDERFDDERFDGERFDDERFGDECFDEPFEFLILRQKDLFFPTAYEQPGFLEQDLVPRPRHSDVLTLFLYPRIILLVGIYIIYNIIIFIICYFFLLLKIIVK